MSMNKFMHPKNIYKSPPNFKQLAIEYPDFRKHVKQDITGKVTLDFKDANALRALTCTLLKKDFGLNVEIPANKLVPTIPLRLNYLLWIDDLLQLTTSREIIKGIDIGTGASCVYPLIGSKHFGWKMVATEVDKESLKFAKDNIDRNCLEDEIELLEVSGKTLFEEVFSSIPEKKYDFCMCNPPFFASTQELHPFFRARTAGRQHPRNAFVATVNEVVSDGGEVQFITKMMTESKTLQSQIRIYTTMIGHKSSVNLLKKLLREMEVKSFKETEFCQGHTTRWGLAWTFCDIDLRKIPQSVTDLTNKIKPRAPLTFVVPKVENLYDLETVTKCLLQLFDKLQVNYKLIKKSKTYTSYTITAHSNTWSHQRRKKREQKRLNEVLTQIANVGPAEDGAAADVAAEDASSDANSSGELTNPLPNLDISLETHTAGTSDESAEMEHVETSSSGSAKRGLEENEEDSLELNSLKKMKIHDPNSDDFYLEGIVVVRRESSYIYVEVNSIDGTGERARLHQILQYVKNNLKIE